MVNVIGLGYIGLPTALMLASHGIQVVGTDYNKKLVETLNKGEITFKESGLPELFSEALNSGILFTTEYQTTDIYIVSVPTPYDNMTKKIDPIYVVSAVETILGVCQKDSIVVIESTVSPGTINKQIRPIIDNFNLKTGNNVKLCHAPERIIPGNMIKELINNNRTIGADDKNTGMRIKELYSSFCKGEIVLTDIKTAEMTKVVENTFRAVNIAFANELAKICRYDNLDVYEIIKICNMHPRVNILQPGPGVGGHCISVDPWFLVGDYPELTDLINTSMEINSSMPDFVIRRILEIAEKEKIPLNRIGLYGLTYKENVDDTRESPTLQLLEKQNSYLSEKFKIYDPWVSENIVENQTQSFDEFLESIDLVVIMVKHSHIIDNFEKVKNKVIFDTCNICKKDGVYKL